MGIITQGIGGPLLGRVGPVVGYMWKHRACLRSLPKHVNYPNTKSQQRQRDWFVGMVRFASCAKEALQLGLHQSADSASMTEGNYFILNNKQHFHRVGDTVEVDFTQLQLSEGSAVDVYFREPKFEANEVISIDFEKNSSFGRASGDDSVYLYVYAPGLAKGLLSAPSERRSKHLKINLPSEWSGSVVHLYGFVVDRNGRSSSTTYIGEGRVNHIEDRTKYIKDDANWQEFISMAESTYVGTKTVDNTCKEVHNGFYSDDAPLIDDGSSGFK